MLSEYARQPLPDLQISTSQGKARLACATGCQRHHCGYVVSLSTTTTASPVSLDDAPVPVFSQTRQLPVIRIFLIAPDSFGDDILLMDVKVAIDNF